MSYFNEQQDAWFSGGIFAYAEREGVKVKVDDLGDSEKDTETAMKRIYQKLGLNWELREIPSDFDPYNDVYEDDLVE